MNHPRTAVALSFAAALAIAPMARAADAQPKSDARITIRQVAAAAKVAARAPIALSEIFAAVSDDLEVMSGPHGFVIEKVVTPEVVVARINSDGTRTTTCVNSEEAARRFLASGGAAQPSKEPKE